MKEFVVLLILPVARVLCRGRRNIILLLPSSKFPKKPSISSVVHVRLRVSAKYQPCDTPASGSGGSTSSSTTTVTLSHIELTSMLDSLGSTLSAKTDNSFKRNGTKKTSRGRAHRRQGYLVSPDAGRATPE